MSKCKEKNSRYETKPWNNVVVLTGRAAADEAQGRSVCWAELSWVGEVSHTLPQLRQCRMAVCNTKPAAVHNERMSMLRNGSVQSEKQTILVMNIRLDEKNEYWCLTQEKWRTNRTEESSCFCEEAIKYFPVRLDCPLTCKKSFPFPSPWL